MKAKCKFCGVEFEGKRASRKFCSAKCRWTWNNGRALEGKRLLSEKEALEKHD